MLFTQLAHYKNLLAQAMQNGTKKGNQTCSRSQECLVIRDLHSQVGGHFLLIIMIASHTYKMPQCRNKQGQLA